MTRKHNLLVSDFDQTLSFNDSGHVLSEMLGIFSFDEKVAGLSPLSLAQSSAELSYLPLHDPEFRRVRRADLVEAGRRIRLKRNIALLASFLERGIAGHRFDLRRVGGTGGRRALGARGDRAPRAGDRPAVRVRRRHREDRTDRARGGRLRQGGGGERAARLARPGGDRVVYVGDGSSDIHVMLHVNRCDGLTIAASEAWHIASIGRRTVMSDDAFSVLIPVLEDILGYDRPRIRALFERPGVIIQAWDRVRTDWLTIRDGGQAAGVHA